MCSIGLGLTIGAMIAVSTVVFGQQEGESRMTPERQALMAEWMKLAAPSEAHEHLNYFVGTWKTKTSIDMGGPGSTPMVSDGKSEMKLKPAM